VSRTVRIFEVLDTIQGEGTLAGMPCTLVRLAGCPLRCVYCDAKPALDPRAGRSWKVEELIAEIERRARPLVLVTGGEPLAQRACIELLSRLGSGDRIVQLETSGAYPIDRVPASVRVVLDIKTPASGEAHRNRWENLARLTAKDEVKFVICSRADFEWALQRIQATNLIERGIPILFSPAEGHITPKALAEWLLQTHLPIRLQLQWHKVIWPEGERDLRCG